ncbi:MAG: hydrogenase maturation nickel metallochaperone HypA [Thermodesulfobacteriota bacterium]
MHEMGIAMQIVDIAVSSIPAGAKNPKVAKVNLRAGKLTAIVPASLTFCFDIATQGTPLAGATLSIEEIPVVVRCKSCGNEWTVTTPNFICGKCQGGQVDIISGRELDIVSLELAD